MGTLALFLQMIVADTGNNRLQVFHVKELAAAPDSPPTRQKDVAVRGRNGEPRPGGGTPLDSRVTATDKSQPPSLGSLANWAQSQAPTIPSATPGESKAGDGGDEHRPTLEPRQSSRESERRGNTAVLEGADPSEDQSHGGCLLVFTGGEGTGNIVKRRTAGESEAGEGPLSQPCDVAYWRARQEKNEDTAVVLRAWTPDVPPWFRRFTSTSGGSSSGGGGGGGSGSGGFSPATADEAFLRGELLSPLFPPDVSPNPVVNKSANSAYSSGEIKRSNQPSSERWRQKEVKVGRGRKESSPSGGDAGGGGGGGGGDGDGEGPKTGTFVVRETGVPGKLQLLFVTKTKV